LLLGRERSMTNEFIECYNGIEELLNEKDESEILLLIKIYKEIRKVVYKFKNFSELEGAMRFTRKIQPDELWLYKNPSSDSYIFASVLFVRVTIADTKHLRYFDS